MSTVASDEHKELASKIRDILSIYGKNEDLISIGAYKAGTNGSLDYAVSKIDKVNEFLTQGINEAFSYEDTLNKMREILND